MGFQVAYVPIGVGTFHLESAQDQFEKSVSMLRGLTADCAVPEKMLLTINDLDAYLDTISPDLIVLQNITFANAAYASEVLKRFDCPIVLWTLREPVIDGPPAPQQPDGRILCRQCHHSVPRRGQV